MELARFWHAQNILGQGFEVQTQLPIFIECAASLCTSQLDSSFNKIEIIPGPVGGPIQGTQTKVGLHPSKHEVIKPGQCYGMFHNEIHLSTPEDGTVTLIDRFGVREMKDRAHSYWQGDGPWVSGKPRIATKWEIDAILGKARSRLIERLNNS